MKTIYRITIENINIFDQFDLICVNEYDVEETDQDKAILKAKFYNIKDTFKKYNSIYKVNVLNVQKIFSII